MAVNLDSLNIKLDVVLGILLALILWHIFFKKGKRDEKYDYTQGDLSPKLGAISTWDTDWTKRWKEVEASAHPDMTAPIILNQQVKQCNCPKCTEL